MIGKIVKGRSFKGCVSYVLGNKTAQLLASEGILGTDTASIINSFYMQSLLNPSLSKCVGHIPLAFSPDDSLRMTDQFMERLAKEYMKAMGIENTQYIVVRHHNTNHPHCHIVFNRVDNNGKTISDKNDRFRNEKVCKLLKDKYNLTYGKEKEQAPAQYNVSHLKGAEKTKHEIFLSISNMLSKVKDWKQLEEALKCQSISIAYKYKGQTDEVQGISFKKDEYAFKGSEIDRKFSYSKLDLLLSGNTHSQEQPVSVPEDRENTFTESIVSGMADIASGLGGLLDFQNSGYDPNEAEAMRQQALERKKKKKKHWGFGL